MSFNRSGYIGRAPGDSAITIAKQYFQPTSVGKTFTFSSGYDPGLVDVYRNGIKLINVLDYAATDGSTISLSTPVGVGSTVQVVAYKAYNVATVKATELDTTVTGTHINLTGDITGTNATISALTTTENLSVSVAATVSSALHVGSALTANAAGDVETIGIITATSFSGDGSALSGIANTAYVVSVATTTGDLKVSAAATIGGAVNIDATTDSTSTSTGALIVDGGLGVAKNVYIGAGLSVAGTLTYEDVTSVDSVGMVTAKSGVNVSGGELTVGSGITMGIAGVATFSGTADVNLRDNVKLLFGDSASSADLEIYHDGTDGIIDCNVANLKIKTATSTSLLVNDTENALVATYGGSVDAYYANSKKFETTKFGTITTGIATATEGDITSQLLVGSGITMGSAGVATFSGTSDVHLLDNVKLLVGDAGASDLSIYHDGTQSVIKDSSGKLQIFSEDIEIYDAGAGYYMDMIADGGVNIYYDASRRFQTTNEGIEVTGFTSTTAGMGVTGGLFEGSFIKAGKLSDNQTLGISTANFFYFTTQETTTATPNIVWNDTYSLSNKMAVGDVASVTVITTAAAGGYSANWTIDGNAVTEEWVGGSAPSAGGADGLDIYSLTIIKTGTGTGDSGFKVIANVSNAT